MNLSKTMTVQQGVVLAVCTLIGSGLLGLPGLAIEVSGGQAAALAWPLTMLMSVPLVLIFLSLSLKVQNSGGIARYIRISFGARAEGATTFILALTFMMCIPLGTFMGAVYIQKILNLPSQAQFWIAAFILVMTTIVNAFGINSSSWINKLSALALVLLVCLFVLSQPKLLGVGISAYVQYLQSWENVEFTDLWKGCALIFWAFLGWENLSFSSEEVSGGEKTIWAIFIWGFVAVSLIYAVLAVVALGADRLGLSVTGVSGLLSIVSDGPYSTLSHVLIVLIVVANVNAWVFAASRLIYAAGRNRLLPYYLGQLSVDSLLPIASLLSMLVVYIILSAAIATNIIPLSIGLIVANQNFIVVYVLVIICYAKTATGFAAWLTTLLAVLSCIFLMVGFKTLLVIPIVLGVLGYFVAKNHGEEWSPS
jgi:amino acid transporter